MSFLTTYCLEYSGENWVVDAQPVRSWSTTAVAKNTWRFTT